MLLDLFVSQFRGRRVPTTSACIAAEVPATTALRWLDVLEQHDLVKRSGTENDGRVRYVSLTAKGYRAVEAILDSYLS
jgi:DNA-binding PadR family transcriptional regulator